MFLLEFLKDEQKTIPLLCAAGMDRDLTWIPLIMGTLSKDISKEKRRDLLLATTIDGYNIFQKH